MNRNNLLQKGLGLEYITLWWNIIGCGICLAAAFAAHSVALAGFGIDSVIEIFASVVVVWQLKAINKDKEKLAEHLICLAFLLLAVYIFIQSVIVFITHYHAQTSIIGIIWLTFTAIVMFLLAYGKATIGKALNNPVLQKESKVTIIDGVLATSVLIGIALNAVFGFWWADPLVGFVIVYYGIKEGLHMFKNH